MNIFLNVGIVRSTLFAFFLATLMALVLAGCASTIPEPLPPSHAHLKVPETSITDDRSEIPEIVHQKAFLPPPVPRPLEQDLERYTVVVNDVPVKELMFALARDASLNVDVDSDIEGLVTLNAVEQTLPQILERISRQAKLRYELEGNNLYISPDDPYFRTYKIDYLNINRESEGKINIATQIATTGTVDVGDGGSNSGSSGDNNSTTSVKNHSSHTFWETLTRNIKGILGDTSATDSNSVIVNPESGIISVRATSLQHLDIQNFIDHVLKNSQRQVLIEATIIEVTLSNGFQAGVDWNAVIGGNIVNLNQNLIAGTLGTAPFFSAVIKSDNSTTPDFNTTIKLLKTYGDVKVLSSPKLMALNNQTAILKVVENQVYFTFDSQISQSNGINSQNLQSINTEIHTVPIGLVMSVTPQINENMAVNMSVRPTISSVVAEITDPGPALIAATANAANAIAGSTTTIEIPESKIPQIAVREMESLLTVNSGQTAILGGLMTDDYRRTTNSVPGLDDLPAVGNAFKQRDFTNAKKELIIFLRPTVISNANLDGDLAPYRQYLNNTATTPLPVPR